ncbi:FG-GAP-like repeat-containing protein [Dyadobacter sp. CY347]|uniref:FG-GAP-like repeat-containing protein n=1 Tax=Dyadobacter sp. CY347 TaxID=2909336 RepID=UPI001F34DAE4|nr:FG-GAP-like repeat-containing protein [Dyadobacter sp. CY347]MCF2490952.1 FG-GAP-like repeat-containing protein [Dyadobacter sp. CY347]
MKQHYKRGIYGIVFLLLAAAYVVKIQEQASGKHIPDRPGAVKAISVPNKQRVVHDSTIGGIQQSLAKREYNISYDEEKKTLQSPNRKHGLRAYYKPGQLTVNNRVDSAGYNFSLRLTNEGVYADGNKLLAPQPDAALDHADNKLQIKHKGFTEEFVNNEEGVRQNFIIKSAPKATKELQVRLSAKGLKIKDLENNELQFYSENEKGQVTGSLIYKDIKCWDADGKTLPATLKYEDGLVMLSVNVLQAAYPVTIDPIVVNGNAANANAMVESNQLNAWMGGVVASAGDVNGDGYSDVMVAASMYDNGESNEGVVFLYNGSASGINTAAPVILEANQKDARFGAFVSSAGDINKDGFSDIIIGAHMFKNGQNNEGAAFVYYGSAQGISKAPSLVLESNQPEANMGNAVGLAGDVNGDGYSDVVVSARAYSNGQSKEGVVFVYHGSAAGLNTTPVLIEQNQPNAMFGFCATGAGDVNGDGYSDILVGARLFDKGQADEGAVFIYHGSALGISSGAVATVLGSNQANAYLGHSVASAGDVNGDGYSDIVVGASMYDKGQTNEGAAFVHYGSAQGVNIAAAIVLEKNQAEAQMGYSVASAGDVNGDGYADVIVGAMFYDNGQNNEGAAFIYQGSATGLSATPVSILEGNQAGAQFGSNVSSAGDVNGDGYSDVLVGAILYDKGQGDEGAAFVWFGMAEGVSASLGLHLEINQPGAMFGSYVSSAGDLNGDGYGDVAISAFYYDNGQTSEGAIFIFHGSAAGLDVVPNQILESNQENASMGSTSSAGDINGDGYGDLIVGIPLFGGNDAGAVFLYTGSPAGINSNIKTIIYGKQEDDAYFGNSVSCVGDVNGDGFSDIIIGSPGLLVSLPADQGAAFVYHGSPNGINKDAANIILTANACGNWCNYGNEVSGGGDINNDGYGDVIVGSTYYSNGESNEGAVYIYYGSAVGLNINLKTIVESNRENSGMGSSIEVGDLNGDGYFDLALGAPEYSNGQHSEGAVFIYYGSINGFDKSPQILESNRINGWMGNVGIPGDINGDGYADLVVGSLFYSDSHLDEGAAFLFNGSSVGVNPTYSLMIEGNQDNALMGSSVAGAGDINGDGYDDIIIGSREYSKGQIDEGAAFVFYGNKNRGLQNNLRLYNSNLTTPINQTQKAKNNFGAGFYAKSFLGRNKGKLVWETKASGQGFSKGANNVITNSTMSSGSQNAYASLGLTGTELKSVIAKQGPSTKVRVRVKYDPALALTGQLYGPWRYLPAYLLGNSSAPAPEDVVDDMSETVKRKVSESMAGKTGKMFYVYPNPASDRLVLESDGLQEVKGVQLLTVQGRSVYRSLGAVSEIDVRNVVAGNYILLITYPDGSTSTRKVVIEK